MTKRPSRKVPYKEVFPNAPSRQQVIAFYAQLGQAISNWQHVERGLYEVLRAFTFPSRPGAEMAAYNSTTAFRTKLMMVDAAARFVFHDQPKRLEEWTALRNRADKLAKRRNDMAHFPVWIEFLEERPERRVHQSPDTLDVLHSIRKRGGDEEPYTAARLKKYALKFTELGDQLQAFACTVPEPLKPPQ